MVIESRLSVIESRKNCSTDLNDILHNDIPVVDD